MMIVQDFDLIPGLVEDFVVSFRLSYDLIVNMLLEEFSNYFVNARQNKT